MNRFRCKLAKVIRGARAWNVRLWGSGGQRSRSHEAEICHKIPFDEISQEQYDRQTWQAHIAVNVRYVTTTRMQKSQFKVTWPKFDLDVWRRYRFRPLRLSSFPNFTFTVLQVFCNLFYWRYTTKWVFICVWLFCYLTAGIRQISCLRSYHLLGRQC